MHLRQRTQYPQIHTTRCGPTNISMLAGCLLIATGSAQAHTYCVDKAVALQTALTAASDGGANANEDNTIQLVTGTYYTANNSDTEFSYNNATTARKLDINGGYNTDCSAITENPELTILDGGGATRVFDSESASGDVSVRYLTFQNGSMGLNGYGAGLTLNATIISMVGAGPVIFDQNIVRNNHAGQGGGFVIYVGSGSTLQFENNLIVGNIADFDHGAGEINDFGVSGASIVNNTFAQNTIPFMPASTTGGLYFYYESLASPPPDIMSNNILWGNSGYDLDTTAVLVDNDYGTDKSTPAASSSGNVGIDPQFSSSTDFHLLPTSPLLGQGTLTPTGGLPTIDIEGHPRSYKGHVDVGAYERGDEIFDDGFED